METITDTTGDEPLSPEQEHAAEQARAPLAHSLKSPLDQALTRPNARPDAARAPTLWDADRAALPPISLNPGNITNLPSYAELEGYGVALAVSAMQALHDLAAKIIESREVLRTDPIKHEAELILDVHDLHAKLTPAVTQRVDAAHKTLSAAIASHEAKLNSEAAIKDNSSGAEVRAYVRSLDPSKRLTVLTQALNSGDSVTVGALLNAQVPSYLSGLDLSADARAALIKQWHIKRDPMTAKQLDLMRAALGKLEHAGSVFIAATDSLVGARDGTVRRARAARDKYRTVTGATLPA